jgi:hypothetical protein
MLRFTPDSATSVDFEENIKVNLALRKKAAQSRKDFIDESRRNAAQMYTTLLDAHAKNQVEALHQRLREELEKTGRGPRRKRQAQGMTVIADLVWVMHDKPNPSTVTRTVGALRWAMVNHCAPVDAYGFFVKWGLHQSYLRFIGKLGELQPVETAATTVEGGHYPRKLGTGGAPSEPRPQADAARPSASASPGTMPALDADEHTIVFRTSAKVARTLAEIRAKAKGKGKGRNLRARIWDDGKTPVLHAIGRAKRKVSAGASKPTATTVKRVGETKTEQRCAKTQRLEAPASSREKR